MTIRPFTPRDTIAGHLAAILPSLPQNSYSAAADRLIGLGYRHNDPAQTLAVLNSHAFRQEDDGDGWNDPLSCAYSCSCGEAEYASWTQHDPGMTGLQEFQDEGLLNAIHAHHAHVAAMLHAGGPVDVGAAGPAVVTVTPEAVEAAANQLRSQTRDFASPDILVRKRARFVLLAAASRLKVSTSAR